jgi:hypothetical protein
MQSVAMPFDRFDSLSISQITINYLERELSDGIHFRK